MGSDEAGEPRAENPEAEKSDISDVLTCARLWISSGRMCDEDDATIAEGIKGWLPRELGKLGIEGPRLYAVRNAVEHMIERMFEAPMLDMTVGQMNAILDEREAAGLELVRDEAGRLAWRPRIDPPENTHPESEPPDAQQ
jgi:hypothetical protein